jgi:hypothetical protein
LRESETTLVLGLWSSCAKKGRGGMNEPLLRHQMVYLENRVNLIFVQASVTCAAAFLKPSHRLLKDTTSQGFLEPDSQNLS